jgi:hypothetical protein
MNNLEKRCIDFSSKIRFLVKKLPKNIGNIEDKQTGSAFFGFNWGKLY